MKFSILLLLVTLMGCSNSERRDCHGTFTVEPGFTSAQRSLIEKAVHRWNGWLDDPMFSLTTDENACRIVIGDVQDLLVAKWQEASGNMVIDIQKMDRIGVTDDVLQRITMHELGHSIGFDHLPVGTDGIMAGNKWPTSDFTEADREQCRKLGFCRN